MNPTILAIGLIALFAGAAWLAIWSRADTKGRAMAMVLFLLGVPAVAAATVETLGHHRPLWTAYDLTAKDYHVLAAVMRQDEAIWLYLVDPGRAEPRPIVIPWSNELADNIQKAMDGAPEGQFILRYDQSLATEFSAHALPQRPEPPAKDEPEPGLTYQQE